MSLLYNKFDLWVPPIPAQRSMEIFYQLHDYKINNPSKSNQDAFIDILKQCQIQNKKELKNF
jgi:hypothetical protein